jgi:hypothetical protein
MIKKSEKKKRKTAKKKVKIEQKKWQKKRNALLITKECIGCWWTVNSPHPLAYYLMHYK